MDGSNSPGAPGASENDDASPSSSLPMMGDANLFAAYTRFPYDTTTLALDLVIDHILLTARAPSPPFLSPPNPFRRPLKRPASVLALTSRRWTASLRPLLFRRLTLWSPADVAFLVAALRSPTSKWLAAHVKAVMLDIRLPPPRTPASKEQDKDGADRSKRRGGGTVLAVDPTVWRELLALTTGLKALVFVCPLSETGVHQPLFPPSHAPTMRSHLRVLKHLAFVNVRFPSFGALVRLLGGLKELRGLYIEDVRWEPALAGTEGGQDDGPAVIVRPPRCHGGAAMFGNLEMACGDFCTDNRMLVWLFAAKSVRHEFVFRKGDPEGEVPGDVVGMVKLVYMCFGDGDRQVAIREVKKSEDVYAFTVRAPDTSEALHTAPHSSQASLTFITRRNPTHPHTWALHHLLITHPHATPPPAPHDPPLSTALAIFSTHLSSAFAHLASVDVLYRKEIEPALDVAFARGVVRKCLPGELARKVSLRAWPVVKAKGEGRRGGDYHGAGGGVKEEWWDGMEGFDPFGEWWRKDWIAEL